MGGWDGPTHTHTPQAHQLSPGVGPQTKEEEEEGGGGGWNMRPLVCACATAPNLPAIAPSSTHTWAPHPTHVAHLPLPGETRTQHALASTHPPTHPSTHLSLQWSLWGGGTGELTHLFALPGGGRARGGIGGRGGDAVRIVVTHLVAWWCGVVVVCVCTVGVGGVGGVGKKKTGGRPREKHMRCGLASPSAFVASGGGHRGSSVGPVARPPKARAARLGHRAGRKATGGGSCPRRGGKRRVGGRGGVPHGTRRQGRGLRGLVGSGKKKKQQRPFSFFNAKLKTRSTASGGQGRHKAEKGGHTPQGTVAQRTRGMEDRARNKEAEEGGRGWMALHSCACLFFFLDCSFLGGGRRQTDARFIPPSTASDGMGPGYGFGRGWGSSFVVPVGGLFGHLASVVEEGILVVVQKHLPRLSHHHQRLPHVRGDRHKHNLFSRADTHTILYHNGRACRGQIVEQTMIA